ncbi:MAG: hypothetical protein K9J13_14585 [Saprospiraceae bacterium]|nr:hypothetical protein [Saprospiraceae bacterium]
MFTFFVNLFQDKTVDHYLYTFSDADIVDIIANPDEWNNLEVEIANKIIKDRKIELSAEIILKAKRNKKETDVKEILKTKNNIKSQAGWFLTIAILSVINSIGLILEWKFYLLFGLGITQVIDGEIYGLTGQFTIYNLLTSALVSSVFVLFWYYAKQEKRWAFLAGIIVYGIDSLIFVYAKDWLSFGFHIFGLIGMVSAYVKLLENKKANNN